MNRLEISREEKIQSLMDFFGLSRDEAIEELVDAGEIEEVE
jgi:hypothetical protein